VNAAAFLKDERLHLGIPLAALVTEVNAGFDEFDEKFLGHVLVWPL
jgi:hypothetical protein